MSFNSTEETKMKFSILMTVYNVELHWLKEAIRSVKKQTYRNWELCLVDDCSTDKKIPTFLENISDERIKVKILESNVGISEATNQAEKISTGEFLLLMDNDDIIHPEALERCYHAVLSTNCDIVYSDQDIIDEKNVHKNPLYKPDWSPDLILSQMYVGHLLGFRRELFEAVGGFNPELNGSQDYDLFLRMAEQTEKIVHIPQILYSWRAISSSTAENPGSKPYAQTAGLKAVQDHLDRVLGKGKGIAKETENYFVYDVRYVLDEKPLVSIIIPTKDHFDLLETAVNSIYEKTDYQNFEILILDNNSQEKETFAGFESLEKAHKNLRVIEAKFEFNWSKLNNFGIAHANGEVYLFLNNDVEVISEEWLSRLVEKAVQKNVGVVGGLLLYEDGTIQHGGVIAGMGGWGDHVFKGMEPVHYGTPFVSPMVTRNVTAVTGACMAISKHVIEDIGGFDEKFIICGSDVEICIRAIQRGYRNIYDPNIRLYHYESKTRDSYIPEVDFQLSDKMYKVYRECGDPYYNINLDIMSCVPKEKPIGLSASDTNLRELKHKLKKLIKAGSTVQRAGNGKGVEMAGKIGMKGLRSLKKHLKIEEYSKKLSFDTHIAEINPYSFRKIDRQKKRVNIIVPSINTEHVFGGISTALKFYEKFAAVSGFDKRMILVDAEPSQEAIDKYKDEYTFLRAEEDSEAKAQIIPYSTRQGSIPISKEDYFIFTGWWTAHCAQEAYDNFVKDGGYDPNPFIYFIQDFEPGFYAWSTRYLLADATYKSPYKQIAVFNSKLLRDYFKQNGYSFYKEYYFDPVLNERLKELLLKFGNYPEKKKKVLIYGRPGTERNAFNLIVAALKIWVSIQDDVQEWEVVSAGEQHPPVELGRGVVMNSVGKLSIDAYAQLLNESYAGISLMASPHPSYPPLEMSVYGIKVITNTFANKDLTEFNENIASVSRTAPAEIASQLKHICDGYKAKTERKVTNERYINNTDVFAFIPEILNNL